MMDSEHKRVKHGELPGQIARRHIISLREKGRATVRYGRDYVAHFGESAARGLRQYLQDKSRKRQRRRDQEAIQRSLDDE